jgi:hypothetical protein
MLEVRERKCREHYGEDVWASAEPKAKACFDFLCGNHTRNLPVVRFNKVNPPYSPHTSPVIPDRTPQTLQAYEKWIQTELGEAIRAAKMGTGLTLPSLP